MSLDKKLRCSILVFLLGALRLFGGFPYVVRSTDEGKLNIKKSYVAILWTCLIVITLVSFSVSSLANAPTRESTTENWTTHIVNYLTYGSSALFFLYLALRSPKLAAIVRSLVRSKAELKRSLVGRSDFIHGMCFLGVVAGVIFFTYCSVRDFTARLRDGSESLFYHIPVTVLDPMIEFTSITLGLLVYYILKVIGLEVMDVVMATSALGQQPRHSMRTPVLSGQRHAKVLPKESCRPAPLNHISSATVTVPLENPATTHAPRRLVILDDVVIELLEYAGPVLFMMLLSAAFNATIMLFLSFRGSPFWGYYASYATVKLLLVLHVACLPDFLIQTRERGLRHVRKQLATQTTTMEREGIYRSLLYEVERVLEGAPELSVCQLFTLERHLMLPMAASVLTFLFFTAQFGLYEDPNSTNVTCHIT